MEKIWKDIVNYEKVYQISNFGEVKSLSRYYFSGRNLKTKRLQQETILSGYVEKSGYVIVVLKGKTRRTVRVHRLVAETFIENPLNLVEVNHKNGIKTDNRVENLEWVDKQGNALHRFNVLNLKNYNHVLTEEQIFEILKTKYFDGIYQYFANKFDIRSSSVYQLKAGKSYKNEIKKYISLHGDYEKIEKVGRKFFSAEYQPKNRIK